MDIRHILVPTDLSPDALRPCRPVGSLARETGATITLLHVEQELKAVPYGAPLAPPVAPVTTELDVERAREVLDEQRGEFGADVEVHVEVQVSDSIPKAIAEYADRHGADLIALSTHGRTGFRHFALGSIAESVLRHSRVPVLAFPRPKS